MYPVFYTGAVLISDEVYIYRAYDSNYFWQQVKAEPSENRTPSDFLTRCPEMKTDDTALSGVAEANERKGSALFWKIPHTFSALFCPIMKKRFQRRYF